MPRYVIKLNDRYYEWSTLVASPITDAMTREELEKFYFQTYGNSPKIKREFKKKMIWVELKGIDSEFESVEELLANNKAGENEEYLSKEEIIEQYRWDGDVEEW